MDVALIIVTKYVGYIGRYPDLEIHLLILDSGLAVASAGSYRSTMKVEEAW